MKLRVRLLSLAVCSTIIISCCCITTFAFDSSDYNQVRTYDVSSAEEFQNVLTTYSTRSSDINETVVLIDVIQDIEINSDLSCTFDNTDCALVITSSEDATITVNNCDLLTGNCVNTILDSVNFLLIGDDAGISHFTQESNFYISNCTITSQASSGAIFRPSSTRNLDIEVNIYSGKITIENSDGIIQESTTDKAINIYPEGDITISGATGGVDQVNIYPASDDYTPVTATMGGADILSKIKSATDETPFPAEYVSPLIISASANSDTDTGNSGSTSTGNPYTVSISAEETAFKPEDTFEVEVQISGDAFAGFDVYLQYDPSVIIAKDVIFTDDDADVDENITNDLTDADGSTVGVVKLSSTGDERDASVNPVTVAIVEFEAVGDGDESNIEITKANVTPEGPPMDYNATAKAGEDLIITVKTVKYTVKEGYAPGYSLIVYNTQSAEVGNVLEYNKTEMYYDWNDDGQVVWLLVVPQNEDVTDLFDTTEENAILQIKQDGDVNGDGDADIVDAQIVHDFGVKGGIYALSDASMTVWLNADVNGDYKVDSSDSLAIQELIHSN